MDDNQKKIARWVLAGILALAAILAVLFSQQTQEGAIATSMAVQLPAIIGTAIQIGIVALLTAGFTWLFNTFGIDLRGQATSLGLVLSVWIVGQLQGLIDIVPAQWDALLNTFFYFLTLILAPVGALFLARKDKEDTTKLL